MTRYILNKMFFFILSLFMLASITFMLMKSIPGDPFMSEKNIPPEIKARIMAHYGLDKPVLEQYGIYLSKLVQGNLGISMKMQDREVVEFIRDSFPFSMKLGIVAVIVSVLVGVTLGMTAAFNHRKMLDTSAMVLAVVGVSVPSFVMASILQWLLGVKFPIFNVVGLQEAKDYVLPTIALAALPIAFIARLTRSNMLEVLHSDYIKTARAKGLSTWTVMQRHVLRNGILPVVTYLGPLTANVITGSFIIEQIFGIAGLGKIYVMSIGNRDYSLIMGITIFYGLILMSARFITDLAYGFIDPRIKLGKRKEKAA
ncbi:ABC transporter permease [Paenibacillus sp. ACRRX]|uniref:ABC transporter permease n=1 Tax=unclassified Paenibacillus TaxID=185978 RepID=UPI001EF66BC7|nr:MULTISPECIES: ABC transporter permease [unclassified Paenibacillus]MCG7406204.1 ABC transporter permease [Paenibacillus sp. ACRRX]MDK8179237.1 ABC transporter permease [Paenibacillus sp. UMB4589-SE434]